MGCVSAETASDQKEGGFRDDPFSLHCSGGTPQVAVPRCAPFPTHSAHARSPMEGCWDARVPVKRGSHLGGWGATQRLRRPIMIRRPVILDPTTTVWFPTKFLHVWRTQEISAWIFSLICTCGVHACEKGERRLQKPARDSHLWSSLWWKF